MLLDDAIMVVLSFALLAIAGHLHPHAGPRGALRPGAANQDPQQPPHARRLHKGARPAAARHLHALLSRLRAHLAQV